MAVSRSTTFRVVMDADIRIGAVAGLVIATLALVGCGGSGSSSSSAGVKGPSEVAASPVSTPGANPFTATVGKDKVGVTPPPAAASTAGGPATYNAGLPGLYGGTRNHASCDAVKLVNFLEQNPSKASAWASTLGIQTTQIRDYVSGLTDVILRTDTRVTNHGYVNGVANPIQSLLEAGTAVFVDKYGRPVVKCYCGNPLTPPVLYTTPSYTGPLWASFSPTEITIINQSTTIINIFTLYDPNTGMTFSRTPGVHGRDGPYTGSQASSSSQSQSNTSATSSASTTQQQGPSGAAAESPSVSLSPNPVIQGGTVTLSASGFAPNTGLQITVNRPDGGTDHFSMSTNSSGSGTYTFTNAGAQVSVGTYNVTVSNPATGAQASGSIDVQAPPTDTSSTSSTTP
jgi:hypothetical protein